MGESGSKVYNFIPELRKFSEFFKLSDDIKIPWIKANLKELKNITNNNNLLVEEPEKGGHVTPCMDVLKTKIQYDGSLYNIKFRIVVTGDLQNKDLVEDTWSQTSSMRTLKYFLADAAKHKAKFHKLDFIRPFL